MLILSRKSGESILIGKEGEVTKVTVLAIHGTRVKIGIEAPTTVRVERQLSKGREGT